MLAQICVVVIGESGVWADGRNFGERPITLAPATSAWLVKDRVVTNGCLNPLQVTFGKMVGDAVLVGITTVITLR